jgi:sulfonate transport system substrate-binding protein
LVAKETGMPLGVVQRAVDRAPFQVLPMDDAIAKSQQIVANRFRSLGLIPTDINVSDQVWRAST